MRLGDYVDDYCSRCKRTTDHAVGQLATCAEWPQGRRVPFMLCWRFCWRVQHMREF